MSLRFVIDSNVFIEAARRYYSFDFGTKFWDFLVEQAKEGVLCSIDKVFNELNKGDKTDLLKQWANDKFKNYFYPTNNNEIINSYKEIIQFVAKKNNQYSQQAIDEFLSEKVADAWIIAFAKHNNLIVVTHESFNPSSKKKVLIPNVCKDFNIKYITTFEMLKELNFRL
ncbi:MAG: DUF4411 family protein [Calditerrivibrio sp.]|nr:DUF4411 family protein [Calditerrivibrio sp.]